MGEKCEICNKEMEELFTCKSCSILFCSECGNSKRNLCKDCEEFEYAEDIKDILPQM